MQANNVPRSHGGNDEDGDERAMAAEAAAAWLAWKEFDKLWRSGLTPEEAIFHPGTPAYIGLVRRLRNQHRPSTNLTSPIPHPPHTYMHR